MTPGSTDALERWREFNGAHARTLHALDRALSRAHGVTACELDVLTQVAAAPGAQLRIQDLSDLVLRSQSTMSRMVGRLEAGGLVTRAIYAEDRRGTVVTLTEEGRDRLRVASDTARDVLGGLLRDAARHLPVGC